MTVINMRTTKGDGFTVIHFDTINENHDIMFRLRSGHGTLKDMTTNEVLISDNMWGFQDACDIVDVQKWSSAHGLEINLLVQ